MTKMRVHELAKELGIDNKELVEMLQKKNIEVKNHMSTVEDSVAAEIRSDLSSKREEKKTSEAAEQKENAAPKKKNLAFVIRPQNSKNSSRIQGSRPQQRQSRPARPAGERPARPAGERPARPAGERPARPAGERPARPARGASGPPGRGTSGASAGERPVRPAGEGNRLVRTGAQSPDSPDRISVRRARTARTEGQEAAVRLTETGPAIRREADAISVPVLREQEMTGEIPAGTTWRLR